MQVKWFEDIYMQTISQLVIYSIALGFAKSLHLNIHIEFMGGLSAAPVLC